MKKNLLIFASMLMAGMAISSCGDDVPGDNGGDSEKTDDTYVYDGTDTTKVYSGYNQLLNTFVVSIVEPTYSDMKKGNQALLDAVNKFVEEPTQDNMNECADAWLNARAPWERSEAYLFGPVEDFNVDPNIDSWPLEVGSITQIIENADWESLENTDESSQEIKGYHTLEYLIFNDGQARKIATDADYNANPKNWGIYMQKVAQMLVKETTGLYAYWFTTPDEQYSNKVFKDYFLSSIYQNPIGEIIEACSGIAEEVGSSKIGGPYEKYSEDPEAAVYEVESWYSWHSRDDYMNNIRGIRYVYNGARTDDYNKYVAGSLRAMVIQALGAKKDQEVRKAIDGAINAIDAIPQPFRSHIHCTEAATAMTKCAELKETLDDLQAQLGLN